jgi:sterol 3beta-glucosyltransferase
MATNGGLQPPSLNRIPTEHQSTENVGTMKTSKGGSDLEAQVTRDGRVNINFSQRANNFSDHLHRRAPWVIPLREEESRKTRDHGDMFPQHLRKYARVPRLNIAIHIVGSRGDVQPFIAIGQVLTKPPYSHRVRICTHPVFKDFVEENGLEFFSIGGDPNSLMAYMVKNPGLLPGRESLKAGDVGKRRAEFAVILEGCWRSCIEAGNGMGDESKEARQSTGSQVDDVDRHFIADAIIANPPSYGHIHCAEKLGIPLHMMFTLVVTYFPSNQMLILPQYAMVANSVFPSSIGVTSRDEFGSKDCELYVVYSYGTSGMARVYKLPLDAMS